MFYSAFQTNAYWNGQYQINIGNIQPEGGGWSRDEWYVPPKRKIERDIAVVETNLIDLQQKAQEIRLKELSLARVKRKDKEIRKLNAELSALMGQIKKQQKELLGLQNDLALLVLVMADPFLRLSGSASFNA